MINGEQFWTLDGDSQNNTVSQQLTVACKWARSEAVILQQTKLLKRESNVCSMLVIIEIAYFESNFETKFKNKFEIGSLFKFEFEFGWMMILIWLVKCVFVCVCVFCKTMMIFDICSEI